MARVNVRLSPGLLDEIDDIVEESQYSHRSDFIREKLRDAVERERTHD